MHGSTTKQRRSDARLWALAALLALCLNLSMLAAFGLAAVRFDVAKPRPQPTAPEPETVATIMAVLPEAAKTDAAPAVEPTQEKPRFARTSDDQISQAPEKPAFIGERNTQATSEAKIDPNAAPLPAQAGEQRRPEDIPETTESDYQDGALEAKPSAAASARPAEAVTSPAQATPPTPEASAAATPTPPAPAATKPTEAPQPSAATAPTTTDATAATETPPSPAASAETSAAPVSSESPSTQPPPKPRPTPLVGPNPVDVPVPKPAEAPKTAPTTTQSPPARNATTPAENQPKPTPAPANREPSDAASSDPAFSGNQRKSAITGSISRTGRSALDVVDSPLGRYQAIVGRAVEREWQRNCVRHRDYITPGFLTVRFYVEANGKVRSVMFDGEMQTGEIQKGFTLNSIRQAEIPPMPPALRKQFSQEPLELVFRFYF